MILELLFFFFERIFRLVLARMATSPPHVQGLERLVETTFCKSGKEKFS